ncbi:MAG: hypothetical protein Q4G24_12065 [Paracoccus sp. (in: a-proteobacteria)]|uniref:hypothetical protein n=1 Tax=Paracoccus sp. TaxID=267 RepID=UPI0026E0F1D1|nr:hypothetical protein [Paracoccus sp. (in: a-proteobacteria)]MDO5622193.1 hypothetical protein [Paracoccus sp. (in: a-proteobacteria)]
MKVILTLLLLALAACASPSPDLMGAGDRSVTEGGIRFSVFQKGNRAQVIRHGWLPPAERRKVPTLMVQAAERATGCGVVPYSFSTRIPGDTGVADMRLDCG